jgi:hypothetical protein
VDRDASVLESSRNEVWPLGREVLHHEAGRHCPGSLV